MFEIKQLRLQVRRRPKQSAVPAFSPNGPDQPFHERMRQGRVRHRFDIFHFEHPEISVPLVEPEQNLESHGIVPRISNSPGTGTGGGFDRGRKEHEDWLFGFCLRH